MESVDVSWDFVVSHRLVFFLKSAFIYSFLFVHNLLSSNQLTMCISHSFYTHVGVQINEFARTITILTISRFLQTQMIQTQHCKKCEANKQSIVLYVHIMRFVFCVQMKNNFLDSLSFLFHEKTITCQSFAESNLFIYASASFRIFFPFWWSRITI